MTFPAPLAWLVAEAEAFPLAARVAFDPAILALARTAPGAVLPRSTGRLAAALADHLRVRARGMSEEQLRSVRDRAWFPEPAVHKVSLARHVARLASCYLEARDGRVGLRTDVEYAPDDDGALHDITSRALRWRWVSLCFPTDLLVAALVARAGGDAPVEHVDLATPQLTRVLQRGCAETHLHVGAAIPFADLWTDWMTAPPDAGAVASVVGDRSFEALLAASAIARVVMSWFLLDPSGTADFNAFLRAQLRARIELGAWHRGGERFRDVLVGALATLVRRPTLATPAALRAALRHIAGPVRREPVDPLARWLRPRVGLGTPETRFAARAIRYLLQEPGRDTAFAQVFWQYQRVRARMFRALVEEPGTAGLDWFSRHFERIAPIRGSLDGAKFAAALRVQSRGLRLTALEARTSPPAHWTEVRDLVRSAAAQALEHRAEASWRRDGPEVGVVLHFVKRATCEIARDGVRRANADPRHSTLGTRFGHWFRGRRYEALAIATALRREPELLAVLRGIDVASKEIVTPTWVLGPLFAIVRRAGERAARRLRARQPDWEVGALRATVHAGEDFRRLMEGLRRMHEAVETGLLCVGDRVGHGLALGADVARHVEAHPLVLQPAEERLDDLLWELCRYRAGDCPAATGRAEYIRAEVARLGCDIYDDDATVDALVEARRLRHRTEVLSGLGYPRVCAFADGEEPRPMGLLRRYLSDPGVYERGQREIEVRQSERGERRALHAAQVFLRRCLARMEVTIETNPTSNLLIGDLGDISTHPVFRLVPADDAEPRYGVPVSINTDNPVTFGSCLGDEFALLYHALLDQKAGAQRALAWIEAAREAGLRSRFTLEASSDPDVLAVVRGRTRVALSPISPARPCAARRGRR